MIDELAARVATESVAPAPAAPEFPRLHNATLGIVSGVLAYDTPRGFLMPIGECRMIREVARFAKRAVLALPMMGQLAETAEETLEWPRENWRPLPPLGSTISAQRYRRAARRAMRQLAAECDVLFIRVPFTVPDAILGLQRPKLVSFGSDIVECVRVSTDYRGLKRLAAMAFAHYTAHCQRKLVREPHTRVSANGRELLRKNGAEDNGIAVVSSSLYRAEMRPRENRDLPAVPRLLFVGYLRPEKGIFVLLDAFEKLRRERPATLTLIGGKDRDSAVQSAIAERLATHPNRADIDVRDGVPFGEKLFEVFRAHDVLVLSSLSEGTPRVLVEARSFGCPVVASNVGGIPTSVSDGETGLLVPPNDAPALAATIAKLLDDDALRRRLIANGLARSAGWSVEAYAATLAEQLEISLTS